MAGLTSLQTVTVNAAFLQEIKEVDQELWQRLADMRHRCQRPINPGQCRQLLDQLTLLRDQLALHFALEEAYGYFDDPTHVQPHVGEAAAKLRQEHRGLFLEISRIVERGEEMYYDDQLTALALWLAPNFEHFDLALRAHEARENRLILDAYDSDIGVGD